MRNDFPYSLKKNETPNNLIRLEKTISTCMQIRHQQELLAILDKKIPIIYIDCSQKWEDDIMFFILKEYIRTSQANNKKSILSKIIWNISVVTGSKQEREAYIQRNEPTIEGILMYYTHLLKQKLQANDNFQYKKSVLDFEAHISFDGLGEYMKQESQEHLYLYIDKTEILSVDEQQRINTLLSTRWRVKWDRRIRVKINNGKWIWKSRRSSTWFRIQSPHDYDETNIYEDELK